MKILVISDSHIVEKWFDELEQIFKEICKQEANELVIAGDYFHKPYPTLKEYIFGAKWLSIFKKKFGKVTTIIGNHDQKDGVSSLDIFKYFDINVVESYIIKDKNYKALVAHFFTDLSVEWDVMKVKLDTLKGYNHIILGHYHMSKTLSSNAFHPGSCRYVNYNEVEQKQKIITMIDTTKKVTKLIPLQSPIPMVDIKTLTMLSEIPTYRIKVRWVISSWDKYKKEINLLKNTAQFAEFKIHMPKVKKNTKKEAKKNEEQMQNMQELLKISLKDVKDKDVRNLLKDEFKEVGLL